MDGITRLNIGTATDRAFDVAVRPNDGHVVLVGSASGSGNQYAFGVFDEEGVQDTSFAGDGALTVDATAGLDFLSGVVAQSDGKIVVAGTADLAMNASDIDVRRYQTNGMLDWGTTINIGAFGDSAAAVALQPADGAVVVAGSTHTTSMTTELALARLTSTGAPDPTFDDEGYLFDDRAGLDQAYGVAVRPDGTIAVAAVASVLSNQDLAAAVYESDGDPDITFAADGIKTTDFGGPDIPCGVAVTPKGKVVVAGTVRPPVSDEPADWAVVRYRANGKLDKRFSGDGKKSFDMGGNDGCGGLALDADKNVVITGLVNLPNNNSRLAAARLTKKGKFDKTFSGDGRKLVDVGDDNVTGGAGAVQPDGKVIVGGSGAGIDERDFLAVRLA